MDSRSRLDYALFQLTPTRTRFDLVICAGDNKEKLTSGLLEPFIAHCKFAKDQISKGGYSITLSTSATWFTKSTVERFVKFVSTPEVLERCITIEREIANIDCSLNANTSSDSQIARNKLTLQKSKDGGYIYVPVRKVFNGNFGSLVAVYGLDEHSNKSAALAYNHEGTTSDAVNEEDTKIHLQRVLETRKTVLEREQAMVYARAIVAGFETDTLQDLICFADAFGSPRLREACMDFLELCNTKSNDRVWMDEVAAMQEYSHSQFSYMEDDIGQELRINIQNVTNKRNGSVDVTTANSSVGHGRHIPQYMQNYQGGPMFQPPYQAYPFPGMAIHPYYQGSLPWTPNMEDSRSRKKHSQDDDFDSSDSSSRSDPGRNKRSSLRKVVVRNINYITSARDEKSERESDDSSSNGDIMIEDQKVTQQWNIFQNLLLKDADEEESVEVRMPSNRASTFVEEFVSNNFEDPNIVPSMNRTEFANKSSTNGKHEEGDWFMRSLPDKVIQEKSGDIFEDCIKSNDVLVNDPLAVQARSLNELSNSQIRTHDIIVDLGSNVTQKKVEPTCVNEPNDLYMVLERDTGGQQAVAAWTPEMESANSNYTKIVKVDYPEVNKSKTKALVGKGLERKGPALEAKSKALVGPRSKKSTATKTPIPNGKSKKEEEKRKKMEELLTQRQKRIAERSASTAKTAKNDKDVKKSNTQVIRSSTIDRLSAARVVNPKVLPTESKPGNKPTKVITNKNGEPKPVSKPTKVVTKKNGVSHATFSQSTAGAEKKKVKPADIKPPDKKIVSKNSKGQKKNADLNNAKQLPKASPIKKNGSITPAQSDNTKDVIEISHKPSSVNVKDIALPDSNGGSANKAINSVTFRINPDHVAKANTVVKVNHEVPVIQISTLPRGKESLERSNSKKKWINIETSSKALSGFKKLLSFGRKS